MKVTFIDPSGQSKQCEVQPGGSLMEVARRNNVAGIEAICGGACSCATCHVYVDASWFGKLSARSEDEATLLEFASEPTETSRLSCQIRLTEELDGIVVTVPKSQF